MVGRDFRPTPMGLIWFQSGSREHQSPLVYREAGETAYAVRRECRDADCGAHIPLWTSSQLCARPMGGFGGVILPCC